jgi:hypothetical protein
MKLLPIFSSLLFIGLVLFVCFCSAQYETCHRWINCPANCSSPNQHLGVTLAWLYSFEEFRDNMDKAITIMNQFWGVYDTDYGPLLHISFNCTNIISYI